MSEHHTARSSQDPRTPTSAKAAPPPGTTFITAPLTPQELNRLAAFAQQANQVARLNGLPAL